MDMLLRIYKAVANQKRLDMLALLLKHGTMSLGEVYTELKIPQATASRNLKILEKANFVSSKYRNARMFYSLVNDKRYHFNKVILDSIREWKKRGK